MDTGSDGDESEESEEQSDGDAEEEQGYARINSCFRLAYLRWSR